MESTLLTKKFKNIGFKAFVLCGGSTGFDFCFK